MQGDVVWLNLSQIKGHEQAGRRPAVVMSPLPYNMASGMALFCPVTCQAKGYPFEVKLALKTDGIEGVVLADQVRSLDWEARKVKKIASLPREAFVRIRDMLELLIETS